MDDLATKIFYMFGVFISFVGLLFGTIADKSTIKPTERTVIIACSLIITIMVIMLKLSGFQWGTI